jgi:hypothetical protein
MLYELFKSGEEAPPREKPSTTQSVNRLCDMFELALFNISNSHETGDENPNLIKYDIECGPDDLKTAEEKLAGIAEKSGSPQDFDLDELEKSDDILVAITSLNNRLFARMTFSETERRNSYIVAIAKFRNLKVALLPETKIHRVKMNNLLRIPSNIRRIVAEAIMRALMIKIRELQPEDLN